MGDHQGLDTFARHVGNLPQCGALVTRHAVIPVQFPRQCVQTCLCLLRSAMALEAATADLTELVGRQPGMSRLLPIRHKTCHCRPNWVCSVSANPYATSRRGAAISRRSSVLNSKFEAEVCRT